MLRRAIAPQRKPSGEACWRSRLAFSRERRRERESRIHRLDRGPKRTRPGSLPGRLSGRRIQEFPLLRRSRTHSKDLRGNIPRAAPISEQPQRETPAPGDSSSSTDRRCPPPAGDRDIRRSKVERLWSVDLYGAAAKARSQHSGRIGRGTVKNCDVRAVRKRQRSTLGCVPDKRDRRRTDLVSHHFAKCSRHHGRRMSNRIAQAIEELDVDILTPALKRN
jgi:hypothetical protein